MKKYIIIILIFAIVSFSITGVLIYLKNNNVEVLENIMPFNKESGEENSTNDEKTIDLYGTFDENDIEIEKLEKKYDGLEKTLKIPQIKGLKNKEVEEKINKDIEKRIDEKIEEIKEKGGQDINNYDYYGYNINEDIYRGFSNVISFTYSIPYTFEKKESYSYNDIETEKIYFNYELVNGERLKFEDLFKKDTDINSIIRRAFYRTMSKSAENLGEMSEGLLYDKEKNMWIEKIYEYDENGNESYKYKEYIPYINEYDINKKINKFINNGNQEFYFIPSGLYIGESYEYIEFKDIANEVVIYNKYLTEESLYENNNIGQKNLWTCAEIKNRIYNSSYNEYGFAEDNLFYEINMLNIWWNETNSYPFKNSFNKICEKTKELSKNKIDEYKQLAKENKDKFYVVYLTYAVDYDTNNTEEFSYLISSYISETIVPVDISYKKDVIDEIIEFYRYYNLGFYNNSGLNYGIESLISNEKYNIENVDRKKEIITYDARSLKEINSLDEIFVDGYEYMPMLKNILSSEIKTREENITQEEINNLAENAEIYFDAYGIYAKVEDFDYDINLIAFSRMDKTLLKIYDLDAVYIIPESDTRKIEKSEIENLTLDELNKAYNEIFARHGHEFKNAELKEYFNSMSWYSVVPNKTVSLNELNEIEKYNLDIIKRVIDDKK